MTKRKHIEDELHRSVAQYLSLIFANNKDVFWTSIENRSRNAIEGHGRKLRGCKAGVPDIFILVRGQCYFIELKKPKGGYLSKTQKEIHKEIVASGGRVTVCKSLNDVEEIIKRWELVKH